MSKVEIWAWAGDDGTSVIAVASSAVTSSAHQAFVERESSLYRTLKGVGLASVFGFITIPSAHGPLDIGHT